MMLVEEQFIENYDYPSEQFIKLIEKYPDDTTIYPGHGISSNLGKEKQHFVYYYRWLEK